MAGPTRTFLVECYAPGIAEAAVAAAAARARRAARRIAAGGDSVEYLGAVLVAADEVVFHSFGARDPAVVERASREALLGHERIVESIVVGDTPGMFTEIERKFRLRSAPPGEVLAAHGADALRIEQVYLVGGEGGGARRVRRTERLGHPVDHVLTHKRQVGAFTFEEDERTVDEDEYRRLLAKADPDRETVCKVRYRIPHGRHLLELDLFEAPPGLVLLEVELESEDERVELPDWLGEWREVTGDPRYFNAELARRGTVVPPW